VLLAAAAFVFVFGFRALYIPFALGPDEGDYSTAAMQALHGQSLYADQHSARPPVLYVYYGAAVAVHDATGWPIDILVHVLGALMAATACALLAFALASRYGRIPAAFGAMLAAFLAASPGLQAIDANAETLMLLPYAAAGLLLCRWARGEDVDRPWVEGAAMGVLMVIAIMTKQVAGVLVVLVVVALLLRRKDTAALAGSVIASAAAATLAVVGWVAATGQLREWLVFGWLQNFLYAQNAAGPNRLAVALNGISRLRAIIVLPIGAVAAGALLPRRDPTRRTRADRWFALAWLALSAAPTALSGFFFPHYFVQTIVPLGLVAALALEGLLEWRGRGPKSILAGLAAATLVILALGGPVYNLAKSALIYPELPLPSDQNMKPQVAEWVRSLTKPSDRVLMWSTLRGLNVYAERMPANSVPEASLYTMRQFVIYGPSAGKTVLGVELVEPMDSIIAQWKAAPPDAVLVTTDAGSTLAELAQKSGLRDDSALVEMLATYREVGRRRFGDLDAVVYVRR
jgi:hypothetical protein